MGTFPAPEYAATVDTTDLGNLGLTAEQEADIIAFLKTLQMDTNVVCKIIINL